MKYIFYTILCFFLVCTLPGGFEAYAQKKKKAEKVVAKTSITGHISSDAGTPLAGAKVFADEGAATTTTNDNGDFSIESTLNGQLLIEAEGYQPMQVKVAALQTSSLISMTPVLLARQQNVPLPFGTLPQELTTGSVQTIRVADILPVDNRQGVYDVIKGRFPALVSSLNFRGIGDATVIVDGVVRPGNTINLQEIESVTVLRDITSRMLYGSEAKDGLIMIQTKRGMAGKRIMNAFVESGLGSPMGYRKFLGAADYMTLNNEAMVNDGQTPRYSQQQIDGTRSGSDPIRYPDVSFYDDTFLRKTTGFQNYIFESIGGNEIAQFYLNIGLKHNQSILKYGEAAGGGTNRFNLRGNVNYKLNNWLKMSLDGVFILELSKGNRYTTGSDYWTIASTQLPNQQPLLIPVSLLTNEAMKQTAVLIDGDKVLGGTRVNTTNIYGEFLKSGYQNTQGRTIQVNSALDFDLNHVTKGLTARAFMSFDFYNYYINSQQNTYAVYEPVYQTSPGGIETLSFNKINLDVKRDEQAIAGSTFVRRIGLYGTVNYDRTFNKHQINGTLMVYADQLTLNNIRQSDKNMHTGTRLNYTYDNRYILSASGVIAGSALLDNHKVSFSPAIAAGWILSQESFLKDASQINFLKLKAGWGILQSDRGIPDYYLDQTLYERGAFYNYNNGLARNQILNIIRGNPDLFWIKRQEINVGMEAAFLNNALTTEINYFRSNDYDQIIKRINYYPATFGQQIPYENYGSYVDKGIEVTLNYNKQIKDFRYQIGVNAIYVKSTVKQTDEPLYPNDYRKQTGKSPDAIFGLVALGLFQNQEEIDNSPTQTYGTIQPGDIKYQDLNGDNLIDDNDIKVIGKRRPNWAFGYQFTVGYKRLNLFVLGSAETGNSNIYTDAYHWIYGDRKYADRVLGRWTPATAATATYPRLSSRNNPNNFQNSTYWLTKLSRLSLDAVQLTYTLPLRLKFTKDIHVYVRGNNLAQLSNFEHERRESISPNYRFYAVGLKAEF